MSEIKKISNADESKISGGVMIDGKQKVLLEDSEKRYEFKCNSCGHIFYPDSSWNGECPKCKNSTRYPSAFSYTRTVLFDYDYANAATWRSALGQDN